MCWWSSLHCTFAAKARKSTSRDRRRQRICGSPSRPCDCSPPCPGARVNLTLLLIRQRLRHHNVSAADLPPVIYPRRRRRTYSTSHTPHRARIHGSPLFGLSSPLRRSETPSSLRPSKRPQLGIAHYCPQKSQQRLRSSTAADSVKIRAHGIQHVCGVAAGFTATHSFHAPSATAYSLQWDLGPRQASPHPERDYTRRRRLELTATSSVYLATDSALVGAQ